MLGAAWDINVTCSVFPSLRTPTGAWVAGGGSEPHKSPPPPLTEGALLCGAGSLSPFGHNPWLGPSSASPETGLSLSWLCSLRGSFNLCNLQFLLFCSRLRRSASSSQGEGPEDICRAGHPHTPQSLTRSPGFQPSSPAPDGGILGECVPLASGPSQLVPCLPVAMPSLGQGNGNPTPVLLPEKIPWTEEPGRLRSVGSLRVRYD